MPTEVELVSKRTAAVQSRLFVKRVKVSVRDASSSFPKVISLVFQKLSHGSTLNVHPVSGELSQAIGSLFYSLEDRTLSMAEAYSK